MVENANDRDPLPHRTILGARLRRLREANDVSRAQAASLIRASESKISRMELGRVGFKTRDISDLLTLYGMNDERDRGTLLDLADEANTSAWWQEFDDLVPDWFTDYLGLESSTSLIRTYEVQFVPGLLQTEDYARAVISSGHGDAPARDIDRRVRFRMRRKQLFTEHPDRALWAVVDEAALYRPIGGPQVLREQVEFLLAATELPNVTLQIIPFGAGGHSAEGGAFSILRFPERDLLDLVYIEQLVGATYMTKQHELDHYQTVMHRLCAQSPQPTATPTILRRILNDLA